MTSPGRKPVVWVVSELYYPETTSTGHYMTGIAESLAGRWKVRAITCQPTYSARGKRGPTDETVNGVDIHRCWSTTLPKDSTPSRIVNMASITASMLMAGMRRFRRGDIVLAVTNPPLLPAAALLAARTRGARLVLKIDDVYPDILVATGMLRPDRAPARGLAAGSRCLLNAAERICVLGRDMAERIAGKIGTERDKIQTITSWADVDAVSPGAKSENALLVELGIAEKFVVLIAGNMGRPHDLVTVLAAAERLATDPRVVFLVVGDGSRRPWLVREIANRRLGNVLVRDPRPRSEQSIFLGACDVALSALVPGMGGISVPSRFYNHLAAGRPVMVVGDRGCEAGRTVLEEDVGWFVEAGDDAGVAGAIAAARDQPELCSGRGRRAREVACRRFSPAEVLPRYDALVAQMMGVQP